ncbi:MAG: hypothetical protein JW719_08600 [Pirellulales bacterium]|nr:hypothetical protein [Pirellulales bacterium]
MIHPRNVGILLAAGTVAALCFFIAGHSLGVCTQVVYDAQPLTGARIACTGPRACVPVSPWGYYPRQWQPWPGDQYRQDIVFPQSIGVERLAAPRGEQPKPLPREIYAKQKTKAERDRETGVEVDIREGAPVESVETPMPFDLAPESD